MPIVLIHTLLLVALIAAQVLLISFRFDAYTLVAAQEGNIVSLLGYAGYAAKAMVALFIALVLGIWPRRVAIFEQLESDLSAHKVMLPVVLQLLSFVVFYGLTSSIFGDVKQAVSPVISISWLLFAGITGLMWMLAFAPARFWLDFLSGEKLVVLSAAAVGAAALILSQQSQALWGPLSEYTFRLSAFLLSFIYPDIVVGLAQKMLGTEDFVVNIAPACSGYEGIGLVTLFTAFYLSIFRQDFRFPQALLLFPIGIATIWFLNSVRIVILIAIGSSFSPAVAVGGFHSQAGWITFILVAIGILTLAHRVSFFSTFGAQRLQRGSGEMTLPTATLIPAVFLLAATLLTAAFSADIDWLYPLRVVLTAGALVYCWKVLDISDYRPSLEPLLIGAVVFAFWVPMIPVDPERDQLVSTALSDTSPLVAAFWLIFRCLGAVITVPIAEELAFRGYLLCRLSSQAVTLRRAPDFSWAAIAVSSLAFGALHSAWVAGTMAGIAYGIARYRGGHIGAAILAHAVTNLMLTGYVFYTGHWSVW